MNGLLSLDKDTLKTVIEALQSFALVLAIVIAVVLIVAAVIIKFKTPDKLRAYGKFALGTVIGAAVVLSAIILFVQISRMSVKNELDVNFWLIVGFFALIVTLAVVAVIIKLYAPKAFKYYLWSAIAVAVCYGIVLIALLPTISNEWEDYTPKNNALMIALTVIVCVAIIALAMIFDRRKGTASPTKQLAYAGICIATSFALSYVKFFSLPLGGSVTLASLLPMMIFSYIFGARKGVLAGVIYGLLQCIQNPQIYQPVQVLLDYPIAFAAIGLAGIGKNMKFLKGNMLLEFIVGACIAVVFRYAAHVISGYFVFYSWSVWDNALLYSFAYNAFTFVDLAVDIAVGAALFSSPAVRRQFAAVNPDPETLLIEETSAE